MLDIIFHYLELWETARIYFFGKALCIANESQAICIPLL